MFVNFTELLAFPNVFLHLIHIPVLLQLFTIGILIYSAFAAIYYAKYTINDYENYDDYLFGRSARSIRSVPSTQTAFLGLPVETYLQIFNAISNYGNK